MLSHEQMVEKMLDNPEVRAQHEALEPEFALFDELLKARRRAGLSQSDVARRMGTKTPAIARLEAGGGSRRHSPSLATLQKYAEAVDCRLQIKLVPRSSPRRRKKLDASP
jgi:transcriptional regulator with XRE-family HTH domain